MQINTRGVLLIAAVALIVLKLAGVIAWPWLAVLVPALVYLAPFIWSLACAIGAVAVGLIFLIGILIVGACASLVEAVQTQRWKAARQAQLKAGALKGPWDLRA
ncbi:hypothetical protein KABACHOK_03230 [Brevundimonas phage vB_BpoS-Kabachok]|uniref:Uncharacterized protein n=1 Tax=Brevundimonas phage vB_BpoS-Kabachok TaxID=2948600 RepID=A0A9E7MPT1_9CAUD|nr:hypothetical protein KABACHOK_03230 [Brevundimonas phage vB_BpoS-Kabachok]